MQNEHRYLMAMQQQPSHADELDQSVDASQNNFLT